MIRKLKTLAFSLLAATSLLMPLAVALPASAAVNAVTPGVCQGADNIAISGNSTNCSAGTQTSQVSKLLQDIVNIFSAIVGVIAVIMIIVGGLRYITSGGDSNKVASAKTTLIYAIIGLIIVALAQIIVRFVIGKASTSFN